MPRASIAPARIWGEARQPAFYVIDGRGNGASLAINRLLKAGAKVSWLKEAVAMEGHTYEPGALLVYEAKGMREAVDAVARDLGLRVTASAGKPPPDAQPLASARIALYKPWVESIDEGWTRWLLEQYEFPFANITDADIRRGGLRARFDAIVLPDMGADRMIAGHPAGTMPPEYVGGLGTDGVAMLRQFVTAGGTLVALDSASELAINMLGAPVTDVTRGLPPNEYFCPGSVIKLELEADPLTYGMPRETAGFCAFNSAFDVGAPGSAAADGTAPASARVIGRYAKSGVLLSGWLEGERVVAGKGAMVEVKAGRGRAVLFGFRTQHRAQAHATFRLFFNALHSSR